MTSTRRRRSRLLVGCCALAASLAGAAEGPAALLSGQLDALATLPQGLRAAEVRSITARRAEVYVEDGGVASAAALVVSGPAASPGRRRHVAGAACRLALVRPQLTGFDVWADQRRPDEALLDAVSRFAMGSVELRGIKVLSAREGPDWAMEVCQVPLSGLRPIDFTADAERILANASYRLAKEEIARDEPDSALERLKLTVARPEVYANAVALMVPLLWAKAPDIAERLVQTHLDLRRLSDADAALFLGQQSEARGAFDLAEGAFRACLALDPRRRQCQGQLEGLFRRAPRVSEEGAAPADPPPSPAVLPAAQ